MLRKPKDTVIDFIRLFADNNHFSIDLLDKSQLDDLDMSSFQSPITVELCLSFGYIKMDILGLIRRTVQSRDVERYININRNGRKSILIADHIAKGVRRTLKDSDINHADLSGDIFFIAESILIDINTLESSAYLLTKNASNFFDKEWLIIKSIVINPVIITYPLRELEVMIGVSKSQIHKTFKKMDKMKLISKNEGSRRIINHQKILNHLVDDAPLNHKDEAMDIAINYENTFKNA